MSFARRARRNKGRVPSSMKADLRIAKRPRPPRGFRWTMSGRRLYPVVEPPHRSIEYLERESAGARARMGIA